MNEMRIIQLQHKRVQIVMDDLLYCLMGHMDEVAEKIHQKLALLEELLNEHKDLEIRFLNPALMNSENVRAKQLSKKCTFEFGSTMLDFLYYKQKWSSTESMIDRPLYFAIETREVFKNITDCLWKKDYGVLPMLFKENEFEMAC